MIVLVFPGNLNLSSNGRMAIDGSRTKLQVELMNLMNDKQYLPEGRFGELLLLIPTLQRISSMLVNKIATAKKEGFKLDELLGDILLTGLFQVSFVKSYLFKRHDCLFLV